MTAIVSVHEEKETERSPPSMQEGIHAQYIQLDEISIQTELRTGCTSLELGGLMIELPRTKSSWTLIAPGIQFAVWAYCSFRQEMAQFHQ